MVAACVAQSLQTCDPMIDRRPRQRHLPADTDPSVFGRDLRQRQACRAATTGPTKAQRAAARQAYDIVWKLSSKLAERQTPWDSHQLILLENFYSPTAALIQIVSLFGAEGFERQAT
jgi:hypothetical protein